MAQSRLRTDCPRDPCFLSCLLPPPLRPDGGTKPRRECLAPPFSRRWRASVGPSLDRRFALLGECTPLGTESFLHYPVRYFHNPSPPRDGGFVSGTESAHAFQHRILDAPDKCPLPQRGQAWGMESFSLSAPMVPLDFSRSTALRYFSLHASATHGRTCILPHKAQSGGR